jgi:hypothetical protein
MNESRITEVQKQASLARTRLSGLLHKHEYPSDTKTILLTTYIDITKEHHEAISLLIKTKLAGSAFALMRVLFDTVFRALWLNACATEEEVEQVARDDKFKFPKMDKMVVFIDQQYATGGFFASFYDASWASMCSYAHSGLLQLTRRITGGNVLPNYSEDDVVEVLNASTTAMILLIRMFLMSTGHVQDAAEVATIMQNFAKPT